MLYCGQAWQEEVNNLIHSHAPGRNHNYISIIM